MTYSIRRGTNISHWLSQTDRRGEDRRAFFVRSDVERIASWGFDHIRIPVDEVHLWRDDQTIDREGFDLLRSALEWCETAGLRAIVDLHILRSHYFNDNEVPVLFASADARSRFAGLWADLSEALRDFSNEQVAYELLNEPVAPTAAGWNETYPAAFAAVREQEPERTIILGSNHFNQYQTFPELTVPEDENLILTFHYYNPMFITHYTAPWWDGGTYSGPIRYPGAPIPESQHMALERLKSEGHEGENRPVDREVMKADISIARQVADTHGCPLYCGEFGCYRATPEDIRSAWYRDIAAAFAALDVSWANWDYRGSFGLVDGNGDETGVRGWLMGA